MNICACYYYDFDPSIHSDEELRCIIEDSQWAHRREAEQGVRPQWEVLMDLDDCGG